MCCALRPNYSVSFYSIVLFMQLISFSFFFSLLIFLVDVFTSGVWATLNNLCEPSLTGLTSRLQSTIIASRAPGTTDAYRRASMR